LDVIEAIKARKSIRGFKKDPVPREIIQKILETAVRAPSGMNTQPWEFIVVGGKALTEISEECGKLFSEGVFPTSDMVPQPFEGVFKQRQVGLAIELFRLMGIQREDKEARNKWMQRGFRCFDGPCEIVVCADRQMERHLDMIGIGCLVQSICLAALTYGLGTCIADQAIMYDQVWRKHANIPDSRRLISGITIGYPDPGFPANKLVSVREPVENITTWLGY
jgi:nitroreductase